MCIWRSQRRYDDRRQRFISPVVVSPSEIDVEIPQSNPGVLRQGLKMIAKIIQTLANNILFGREAHMSILNSFLEDKVRVVVGFLSELSVRRVVLITLRFY